MFEFTNENILDSKVDAIVNTVNCVGIMGKGLALQFKHIFPDNFKAYQKACRQGKVCPGHIFIFEMGLFDKPKYIFNFPTKRHWREDSYIEDIKLGLKDLVKITKALKIKSIAIPPLGCGNGKLLWSEVRNLIIEAFKEMDNVVVKIIEPHEQEKIINISLNKPKMSRARALLIKLIGRYTEIQDRLTLIEIQKLAYFLQESGEDLKLKFEQGHYGPFANNLNKALQALEGHYIKGFNPYNPKPNLEIQLIDNILENANEFLINDTAALLRLELVENLIDGFETPYGLELLATVHWIVHYAIQKANNPIEAVDLIHKWNSEKRKFNSEHIEITWNHLKKSNWI